MDAKAQLLLVISVAAIMLTMGLGLAASDFRRVGASPRAVVVGLVGQLVLLPVLAFVHAWAFALPTPLAIGLVLIAAVPGGAHSNLFASFAKADTALSVSLTALSSVITIVTIPLVLTVAIAVFDLNGQIPPMPVGETMAQIFLVMGLPVGLGMLLRHRSERWAKRVEGPVKTVAALLLIVIIVGSFRGNGDKLAAAALSSGAAVVTLNVTGMLMGWWLARAAALPLAQRLTITLEVGIQNGTLAFALGLALMNGDPAVLPPVFLYSLLVYFTGAVLVVIGRRAHAREANVDAAPAPLESPA